MTGFMELEVRLDQTLDIWDNTVVIPLMHDGLKMLSRRPVASTSVDFPWSASKIADQLLGS